LASELGGRLHREKYAPVVLRTLRLA